MQWRAFVRKVKPDRIAYYGVIGAVVLIVGSFAIWRIISYFSPYLKSSGCDAATPPVCTKVILASSDHSLGAGGAKILLPDSLNDTKVPFFFDDINSGPTPVVTGANNNYILFRLEGQVMYR